MIRQFAAPRPDPTLQRRLSPSMQGVPIQLSLLPDPRAGRFTKSTDPTWRHFRWQEFEQRPIPWTGCFAYKLREGQDYRCGTMMLDSARYQNLVTETIAAEWAEHLRQLEHYNLTMAGLAPKRIVGPESPPADPTPIEEWISIGRVHLPELPSPPPPRWRMEWRTKLPGFARMDSGHYVAVPSGVKRLSALEPPIFLRPNLKVLLHGVSAGCRIMEVMPPGPSRAPPIKVLYGGPPACRPEWETVYRTMVEWGPSVIDWPSFYAAASDHRAGGLERHPPEVTAALIRATTALGYDVVHWHAADGPRGYACALLTSRSLRHARHTDPLPRSRLRRMLPILDW